MTTTICIASFLSTLSLRRATKHSTPNSGRIRFLSTLSLRRATGIIDILNNVIDYFYPRSPCGERHDCEQYCIRARAISIHALLAESDNTNLGRHRSNDNFYPRSPCGERLLDLIPLSDTPSISIHALLAESDTYHFMPKIGTLHFYPRSPCGERLLIHLKHS